MSSEVKKPLLKINLERRRRKWRDVDIVVDFFAIEKRRYPTGFYLLKSKIHQG